MNASSKSRGSTTSFPNRVDKHLASGRTALGKSGLAAFQNAAQEEDSIELRDPQRGLPPWLISFIIHVIVIIILVLIPLHAQLASGISLTGFFGASEGEMSFDVSASDSQEMADSLTDTVREDLSKSMTETPIEIPVETPMKITAEVGITEPALAMGLAGRSGSMKSALLRAYGGTAGTEDAVKLGLKWLAKQQRQDGSWSLLGPYASPGIAENKAAATGMAMLAFLGAGHTHREGEYRDNVNRGLYYLLQIQKNNGFFADKAPDRQQMYAQAQCTIALCELYGMTKDESLHIPCRKAIEFAEYAQSDLGGWRYHPKEDSDTSVTGWYVMALMSGKMAGLSVKDNVLANVTKFLDSVQHEGGALYSYLDRDRPSLTMTAEGLLCRQYLGWKNYDPRLKAGSDVLLDNLVSTERDERAYYYWYYATQMLHHLGGPAWEKWNGAMRIQLPAAQEKSGREAGSWSPAGEQWGVSGGRIYSTCMALYCLEVYYRHMPLYGSSQDAANRDERRQQ